MSEVSAVLRFIGKDQASSEIRKVRASVNELQQTAKKGGLENVLGPLSSRFSSAAVVGGLGLLGRSALQAASNLEELESKARFVFGDTFTAVAERSDVIAESVGRASSRILQMAADYGAIIQPMGIATEKAGEMGTSLAQLAVDMSSFHNATELDAFVALRSAITGETEPMKRFGVVMTQANLSAYALSKGIRTKIESLNQAQMTALRYNYILDKTQQAQGDAARTSASFANQSRRLKDEWRALNEELGKQVTPVAAKGLGVLADYLGGVFVPAVQTAAREWGAFLELIGTSDYGQEVSGRFKKIFGGSAGEVFGLITGSSRDIKNYQKDLSLEDVISSTGKASRGATTDIKGLVDSLAGGGSSLSGGAGEAADELGKVQDALGELGRDYRSKTGDINQSLRQLEESHRQSMQSISDEIQGVRDQLSELDKDYGRTIDGIDRSQADLLIRQEEKVNSLKEKLGKLTWDRDWKLQAGNAIDIRDTDEIDKVAAELEREQRALEAVRSTAGTGTLDSYKERSVLTDFERDFAEGERRRTEAAADHEDRTQQLNDELKQLNDKKTLESEVYTNSRQQLELTRIAMIGFEADLTAAMLDISKVTEDTLNGLKIRLTDMKTTISEIDALVKARADLTGGGSVADRRAARLANTPDSFLVPNANGGIYDRPTAALIGEAGYAEAVIPMPFGNVPVKLQGESVSRSQSISIGPFYVSEKVDVNEVVSRIKREIQLSSLGV